MKKYLVFLSLTPLLMSMSPRVNENNIDLDSLVLGEKTKIFKLIDKGSIKKICPSHILNNEAASIVFNYEIFEKRKDYAPYSYYKTSYHVLYRADIFLSNEIHYMGGVGNWYNGFNPAYIDYLAVSTTFSGGTVNTDDKKILTPELKHYNYSMIKDLTPESFGFGSSLYNNVDTVDHEFETNIVYKAKGYTESWEKVANFDGFQRLNNRLVARTTRKLTDTSGSLVVDDKYDYGYRVFFNNATNKMEIEKGGKYDLPVKKEFISGPIKGQRDFRFSIFGALNLQTDKVDRIMINVDLNTYHGSSVWLDKFRSNALIDIDVSC